MKSKMFTGIYLDGTSTMKFQITMDEPGKFVSDATDGPTPSKSERRLKAYKSESPITQSEKDSIEDMLQDLHRGDRVLILGPGEVLRRVAKYVRSKLNRGLKMEVELADRMHIDSLRGKVMERWIGESTAQPKVPKRKYAAKSLSQSTKQHGS